MPAAHSLASRRLPRRLAPVVALLAAALLGHTLIGHAQRAPSPGAHAAPPQPVTAATARREDLPVWLGALGTVTPRALVNVMPRVGGLLQSVDYRPGQLVRRGQLLATIDAAPLRIALEQARAQAAQARAQLAGAREDLARYESLLAQNSIAAQQVADQRATVAQLAAAVQAAQAAVDNAALQLSWTRITAPVAGLAGLRPVDAGNMVSTNGAIGAAGSTPTSTSTSTTGATPVAVIAQVQPIDVAFSLPQQQLQPVLDALRAGRRPLVQAWDSTRSHELAAGTLYAADNRIDASTGTLMLRAEFANRGLELYPNQFVDVRVLLRTVAGAVVVPTPAVAVGAPGTYVYVIGAAGKVALRRVSTGATDAGLTQITAGLNPGEQVVTDGLDRLHDGAVVHVVPSRAASAATPRAAAGASGARDAGGAHRP
jgi:multidrug efflux system membrane fusion protein